MLRSLTRPSAMGVIVAVGLVVAGCSSSSSNTLSSITAAPNSTNSSTSATATYAPAQATISRDGFDCTERNDDDIDEHDECLIDEKLSSPFGSLAGER